MEVTPNPRFDMEPLQRRCTCFFGAGYERSNGWHEGGGVEVVHLVLLRTDEVTG